MRKWNKIAAGAVVTVVVVANSLTALAYEDTIHVEVKEGASQDKVEHFIDGEVLQFIPDEVEAEMLEDAGLCIPYVDEIRYEKQFVDEEGNVYEIWDEEAANLYRSCQHTYVSGREVVHDKKWDGSCFVQVFEAERCSKCGWVLLGDFISETKYAKCPH